MVLAHIEDAYNVEWPVTAATDGCGDHVALPIEGLT
jgi:hypothetical protein